MNTATEDGLIAVNPCKVKGAGTAKVGLPGRVESARIELAQRHRRLESGEARVCRLAFQLGARDGLIPEQGVPNRPLPNG